MDDHLEQRILEIVQEILQEKTDRSDLIITADDSMETVPGWDSLTFMSVFQAINEAFGLNPDFDDAIHYTSVTGLRSYLESQVERE